MRAGDRRCSPWSSRKWSDHRESKQDSLMVAVCSVWIANHPVPPLSEAYRPELAVLFTESELVERGAEYGYVSRVCQVCDRLRLGGFTAQRALDELEVAVRTWLARGPSRFYESAPTPAEHIETLLDRLRKYVNSPNRSAAYHEPGHVFEQLDARTILCLALDRTEDKQLPVRYGLDALVYDRLITRDRRITEEACEARQQNLARDAPLVVLTEGSSDSRILTAAVKSSSASIT